jgi:hypothetical protein
MRRLLPLLVRVPLAAVPAGAAERLDYARVTFNILPPGQSGSLDFQPTATDQLALYDALTARRTPVGDAELGRYFKPVCQRTASSFSRSRKTLRPTTSTFTADPTSRAGRCAASSASKQGGAAGVSILRPR